MSIFNMRTIVRVHLSRERIDILLSVLAPLVIMLESGYANAWDFAGGRLGLDFNSLMAFGRGLFLEALIYVCFKLVRLFLDTRRYWVLALPFLVGMVGMIVSAGCNLGWMLHSPEMVAAVNLVAEFMPGWMAETFRLGLGLIFPVAVGLFALFDVRHLVEEALKSSHLDNRALHVHRAEMHRTSYLKSLKKAGKRAQKDYDAICEADTQNMVNKARNGDLTFGADDLHRAITQSSVTRVSPVPPVPPARIPGPSMAPVPLPTPRGPTANGARP